jgi:hypothetical protein
VYRLEDGKENEVEREFLFSPSGSYTEMEANPALISPKFRVSAVLGHSNRPLGVARD